MAEKKQTTPRTARAARTRRRKREHKHAKQIETFLYCRYPTAHRKHECTDEVEHQQRTRRVCLELRQRIQGVLICLRLDQFACLPSSFGTVTAMATIATTTISTLNSNATAAAKAAGYSAKTAYAKGSELLKRPRVAKAAAPS